MLSVEEARTRILSALGPTPAELVPLTGAHGRVLAEDVVSRRTHPPADVSAMDGYAVRAEDVARLPARLTCIGEAPAGRAFPGTVGAGEAVRILTGGPVPAGANAIVLQEDVEPAEGSPHIVVRDTAKPSGRHIRARGLDLKAGEPVLRAGTRLTPRHLALAAAANLPWLSVHRRPRVAFLATGSELARPGEPMEAHHSVASNGYALAAYAAAWGGEAVDLGIAGDTPEALRTSVAAARGADLLVTSGGASVGDYDLIRSHLPKEGLAIEFWRIAIRPGKPLLFGRLNGLPLIGLPGNPVSALVCALLFLYPALARLSGRDPALPPRRTARLQTPLKPNGPREDYMRAGIEVNDEGGLHVTPFEAQDSSMLSAFARADALLVRPPLMPATAAGDFVQVLMLGDFQ